MGHPECYDKINRFMEWIFLDDQYGNLETVFSKLGKPTDCNVKYIEDDIWCAKLAFLANIFNYLNNINRSTQGKNENIS